MQQRSLEVRNTKKVGAKAPRLPKEPPVESSPHFIEDAPRFEREYEAQWVDNGRDPFRNTGRTTAIALNALSLAIAQRGRITYAEDHYPGRSGQTALLGRVESIAKAMGWPVDIQPERGSGRIQIVSRYVPQKVWV